MSVLDTTAIHDGVSAHRSADTPSPFDPGFADALLVLEFGGVLELVAAHAAGPLGADRVRQRRPSRDPQVIQADLHPVAELLALFDTPDDLEVSPVPPLASVLARLRLEGSVLEGVELLAVRQTLAAGRAVASELKRIASLAPLTAQLLAPVPEAALEQRIGQVVDERGEVLDTASPALLRARREVQDARERLVKQLEAVLRGVDGKSGDAGGAVTIRNGRYVIPVRRDARARPQGIVHDESASGQRV